MSAFFSVLLKILIVLGICLGSVIALVLLVLALVLFVPIRYKAGGSYERDASPKFNACVSWLLHVVSFKATYTDKFEISLKVFGIKIKLDKSKDSGSDGAIAKERAACKADIPENFDDGEDSFDVNLDFDDEKIDEFIKSDMPRKSDKDDEAHKDSQCAESAGNIAKDEKEDSSGNADDSKADDSSSEKDSTKTKIYDKIKQYVEIIQTDLFARCFEKCKVKLIKLFKLILPTKLSVDALVGFDDPSTTGKILAISGMLIPIIGRHVSVVGSFDEEVLNVKGKLKGRICIFKVLLIGASVYFDRRIRRLIKIFKKI